MQAVNMIREVESQLEDNPFVMFIGVLCRCTALMFPDLNTDVNQITAEGRSLVEKLEQYPNGWASPEIRAGFFEIVEGSSANTRDAFATIRNDWWFASRAAVLMRGDHLQKFLDSTAKASDGFPLRTIGEASSHALAGDSRHAMKIYEKVSGLPSWPVRVNSLEIPLLLKDTVITQRDASLLLEQVSNEGKDFFDPPFWIFELRLHAFTAHLLATYFAKKEQYDKARDWFHLVRNSGQEYTATQFLSVLIDAIDDGSGESYEVLRNRLRNECDRKCANPQASGLLFFDAVLLYLLGDDSYLDSIGKDGLQARIFAPGSFDPVVDYFGKRSRNGQDATTLLGECERTGAPNYSVMHAHFALAIEAFEAHRMVPESNLQPRSDSTGERGVLRANRIR